MAGNNRRKTKLKLPALIMQEGWILKPSLPTEHILRELTAEDNQVIRLVCRHGVMTGKQIRVMYPEYRDEKLKNLVTMGVLMLYGKELGTDGCVFAIPFLQYPKAAGTLGIPRDGYRDYLSEEEHIRKMAQCTMFVRTFQPYFERMRYYPEVCAYEMTLSHFRGGLIILPVLDSWENLLQVYGKSEYIRSRKKLGDWRFLMVFSSALAMRNEMAGVITKTGLAEAKQIFATFARAGMDEPDEHIMQVQVNEDGSILMSQYRLASLLVRENSFADV